MRFTSFGTLRRMNAIFITMIILVLSATLRDFFACDVFSSDEDVIVIDDLK